MVAGKGQGHRNGGEADTGARGFSGITFSPPARNAFNRKTSWWVSKRGYVVARYCFTAETEAEVERQLQSADSYIGMFEEGLK